ncbi:baseplate J/gp47 family protein [Swingsia samuiensis]|uniref:Baseplate protein J-like barrel domain-containing protein n=1 Tax=Swingsia samuiensis TaxID=1293412 RepID=A0A4Y6UJG7_9PROT|nr:baseplate J/gp47 family protein [Swingsia samuiensis]QDH16778.1 hypothetical protein E3D00_03745 [Swingsia samuiensis]
MLLPTRSLSSFVTTALRIAQSSCNQLLDISVGSPVRALVESVGSMALWLQHLIIQMLLKARLATSSGVDCDSFVEDFGMVRLPGQASTGAVTMTSFISDQISAVIMPGDIVRTVSGLSFSVVKDTALATWSPDIGGYIRQAGTQSILIPVECQVKGSIGNVDAGAIALMGTSIAGIDVVTNENAFLNGSDQESDIQLRKRFPLWLASRATASEMAVGNAISNVQTGISYFVKEGADPSGALRGGYFTVVVDDGSGVPTDDILARVYKSIDEVRALGVGFSVLRPSILVVDVSMTVVVPFSTSVLSAESSIRNVITEDIRSNGVGNGYAYSRLSYLAYVGARVDVSSVLDVRLNGEQKDIIPNGKQTLIVGSVQINVIQK